MCSSFVLELLSPFLWPIEIHKIGESFSRISFWDSLLVNSIEFSQSLGWIGVLLIWFCLDLVACRLCTGYLRVLGRTVRP